VNGTALAAGVCCFFKNSFRWLVLLGLAQFRSVSPGGIDSEDWQAACVSSATHPLRKCIEIGQQFLRRIFAKTFPADLNVWAIEANLVILTNVVILS
jgi:hypothetical protein